MKNDKGSQSLDVRIHFLQVSEVLSWKGLLRWLSGKESACLCRRCKRPGFDPWVGKISWRKKWKPTPVFLPGEVHGQRRLAGYYSPWGRKESDMTERMHARTHTHTHTHTLSWKGWVFIHGLPGNTEASEWTLQSDILEWLMDGHGSHHALLLSWATPRLPVWPGGLFLCGPVIPVTGQTAQHCAPEAQDTEP